MDETGVEVRPTVGVGTVGHMPERVDPVGVIQVCVQAEDLAETSLAVCKKRFGEAGGFAEPVAGDRSRKGTEWGG